MVWAKQAEMLQVYNATLQPTVLQKPPYSHESFTRKTCAKSIQKAHQINFLLILKELENVSSFKTHL